MEANLALHSPQHKGIVANGGARINTIIFYSYKKFDDYCDSVCDGPCDCDDPDCIPDECDLKREVDEAVDGNGDEP